LLEDLDTSRCRRVLQKTVEPRSARTVLRSAVGKLNVHERVVLSQAHDVRRRRYGADRLADAHLVENVETRRMDGVSRQNLIRPKWILFQE
jgi:hypothetical protein